MEVAGWSESGSIDLNRALSDLWKSSSEWHVVFCVESATKENVHRLEISSSFLLPLKYIKNRQLYHIY